MPAWAVSLLAHAALLALLALLSFSTIHERFDFSLSFDADPWEEETELELVSFDSLDDLDSLADPSPVPEVEPLPLSPVSETQLADAIAPPAAPALLTPTMGLGGGLLQLGTESVADALPKEQPLTATFFGTEVEGNRIVYVVDNSGGMRGGELEALAEELLRSVESLRPDQRFYVIFYSDMLYPLFYPRPVDHFVQADDRTKQRLRQWLAGVEFCLGNVVDEAVAAAASIRPDVVYLLTDGDLDSTRDQRRMGYLLNTRGRRFKIHTFGMGTGNSGKAAEKLKLVAEKNRGKFHPVEVTVEFKQRAEATNRPYHNKEPGRVWGLSVGGGWGR